MTVKQGLKRIIIKKTIILLCIAVFLGFLCYLANTHDKIPDYNNAHLIYTVVSVGLSLSALAFIAYKMRYFHDIFGKEWTGTIVSVKREIIRSYRANMSMDDLVLKIKLDNSDKIIKLRLPGHKVGKNVYFEGDRIHRIKGTRYPINLTREEAQHICPICGHDSCIEDTCPNCKIKY